MSETEFISLSSVILTRKLANYKIQGAKETMPAVVNQKNVAKRAIFKPNKPHKTKNETQKFIHLNKNKKAQFH